MIFSCHRDVLLNRIDNVVCVVNSWYVCALNSICEILFLSQDIVQILQWNKVKICIIIDV